MIAGQGRALKRHCVSYADGFYVSLGLGAVYDEDLSLSLSSLPVRDEGTASPDGHPIRLREGLCAKLCK